MNAGSRSGSRLLTRPSPEHNNHDYFQTKVNACVNIWFIWSSKQRCETGRQMRLQKNKQRSWGHKTNRYVLRIPAIHTSTYSENNKKKKKGNNQCCCVVCLWGKWKKKRYHKKQCTSRTSVCNLMRTAVLCTSSKKEKRHVYEHKIPPPEGRLRQPTTPQHPAKKTDTKHS